MRQWAPDEALYPDQGVAVDQRHGLVGFATVRALGGKFAYLGASRGAGGQDTRFVRNLAAARKAGLKAGAIHVFDPCVRADGQSANFVRVVPRDSRSEEHTSELQSLMRISYAVFCLKKKKQTQ